MMSLQRYHSDYDKGLQKRISRKSGMAVPFDSGNAVMRLKSEVDDIITAMIPGEYDDVCAYYDNFEQLKEFGRIKMDYKLVLLTCNKLVVD
jgi:hypothetical protein